MVRIRSFLFTLLACPTLLLTGAVVQPAAPSAPLDYPAPPAGAADAATLRVLDQAVALLAPERVAWLAMTVWQRVDCDDDLSYEAEGRYLAAPEQRRSLRVQVSVGRTRGHVQAVSDGRRLWQTSRIGDGPPTVTVVDLPAGSSTLATAAAGQAFLQGRGLAGAWGLLSAIRQQLRQPRGEKVRWCGREVVRITGEWPTDGARLASLPEDVPLTLVPRRCRVYLDSRTLWPCRVEWWGQEADSGADVLLSQIEFRAPVINRPLSPEACVREFTVTPAPGQTTTGPQRVAPAN
jgi:hypothetical protein